MASIRRALFPSSTNSGLCCSSESMVETLNKDSISHESEPTVDYTTVVVQEKTRVTKKILVVSKTMSSEIHTQLTGMPLLHDIPVVVCLIKNLSSVCSGEKFALVFVDMKFDENLIVEICNIIRFNVSSPNKSVAIIGVDTNQDAEVSSSQPYGLTEVISLPLKEDDTTQLLLKYAGIVPYQGLPLTPESPDDDIAVARKAEEIIRESEEQCSFFGYNHKESDKVESSFNGHPGQDYFTNSITNTYTHSTSTPIVQDPSTSRQPSTFINQELRRSCNDSSSSNISRELNESFQDKPPNSWTINNDQISQNLSQSLLPIPRSCLNQQMTQTFSEQFANSYQHDRQQMSPALLPASLQQPTLHLLTPVPTMSQKGSIPSCEATTKQPRDVPTTSVEGQDKVPKLSPLPNEIKEETPVKNSSYMVSGAPGTKDMKITMLPEDLSKHSSKERIRRERIKDSCDKLRYLLPNISGKKTDMASILEMTVKFVKLVKERVPSTLMDEIGDSLSVSTMGMARKRVQKDQHLSKPKTLRNFPKKHEILRPRMMTPVPVSVPSVPLTAGDVNHIIYTTFSNNNRPIYHQHGQHCNSSSIPNSQYLQGLGYNTAYSPIHKDIHPSYIHPTHGMSQGLPKDIPGLHIHKEPPLYHHNYQPLHSSDVTLCPHRQLYGGPPLSINTSSTQWNYMKLPPMSAISPCSSVCLSSNEDPETISGSSNASYDSPLWDETTK